MRWIRFYAPLGFSLFALFLSLLSFYNSRNSSLEEEKTFAKRILTNVRSCIEFNESIAKKDDIYEVLNAVEKKFQVVEQGSDDLRVKFVQSQGCIEHALACFQALGEIDQLLA